MQSSYLLKPACLGGQKLVRRQSDRISKIGILKSRSEIKIHPPYWALSKLLKFQDLLANYLGPCRGTRTRITCISRFLQGSHVVERSRSDNLCLYVVPPLISTSKCASDMVACHYLHFVCCTGTNQGGCLPTGRFWIRLCRHHCPFFPLLIMV